MADRRADAGVVARFERADTPLDAAPIGSSNDLTASMRIQERFREVKVRML